MCGVFLNKPLSYYSEYMWQLHNCPYEAFTGNKQNYKQENINKYYNNITKIPLIRSHTSYFLYK